MLENKNSRSDQGFASIIVAIVLVIVLTLMTVGFAELMRNEQRSALDKQLNSQAYYAAETGVNDATLAINSGYNTKKDTCGPNNPQVPAGNNAYSLNDNSVGGASGTTKATYSCLLINPYPNSLEYSNVADNSSKVIQMQGINPANNSPAIVNKIVISWQDANKSSYTSTDFINSSGSCGANHSSSDTWAKVGYLRTQIIPVPPSGMTRDNLTRNSYSLYLCPQAGQGGSYNALANTQGSFVPGNCVTSGGNPNACTVTIENLGTATGSQSVFILVLRSIYASSAVKIKLYAPDETQLNIGGAQALIDSTGKAQDVLRRIQVRVPIHNNYNVPDGTQGNKAICKQLQVYDGSAISACN